MILENFRNLLFLDFSPTHVIKKLQTKKNSNTAEVFQTAMLERRESHEIKDFYFGEIQKNMHDFECQWRTYERNYKGVPLTHKNNLTGRRDQHGRRDAGNMPIENRLGLSFQDELQIFCQTEGKIYECNAVEKSINSSSSVSPLQRIPPCVQTNISNKCGNDFMHPSILTQDQKSHREKPCRCNE
ncbi:zinc finger protein 836-like [Diceros bicornis minor]|uniref:zinc finger protein 836-like n=1 Tax=Diceros bicornis minor TaxID=77932 RepID=UPI0026E96421|nr:zinc finger protein 836-like [Diceros bicornis minor]